MGGVFPRQPFRGEGVSTCRCDRVYRLTLLAVRIRLHPRPQRHESAAGEQSHQQRVGLLTDQA
jgi:hypothetical protein